MTTDDHPHTAFGGNITRFTGFADTYDDYRPQPPAVVPEILTALAGMERPALVVDLGSGTGLSTRIWAGKATDVVGIEPSDDMRHMAESRTRRGHIRFLHGFSHATGLAAGSADIVTCCQALHWMEPGPTFREIARILRLGGVFAACDCDWPPLTERWEADAAYREVSHNVDALTKRLGLDQEVRRWAKSGHLSRITESGCFRFAKEIAVHQVEPGGAERYAGLLLSQGSVETLLKRGLSEDEIGLTAFRATVTRLFGDRTLPFYFTYRVRIGIR